ncbi:MAG: serine/threonine protein kinase [Bacteroidetes bacterium]|nr:MAG: serine/threonine protein kinase [Bacteroidota bacterium]
MQLAEKYQIIKKLGNQKRRKFGDVYLIKDKTSEELFVLKVLSKSNASDEAISRFRNEASFTFENPYLPNIQMFYESEEDIFIILKYKQGTTLQEYWDKTPKKEQLTLLKSLFDSLRPVFVELQKLGIVHCDIKPSNILVDKKENKLECYLIDFGLAVKVNEDSTRKTLFPLGYAAPELILNRIELIDQRTDIFSLGVTIWRLFTGQLPLIHPNPSVTTNLQITHPLPESDKIRQPIFHIIRKMSAKYQFESAPNRMSPDEVIAKLKEGMNSRYNNLNEIIEDLDSIQEKPSGLINKVLYGILKRN